MNLVCRLRGGEISTRPSDPQATLGAPLDFSGLAATAVGSACWPARTVRRRGRTKSVIKVVVAAACSGII